jgi:hypothetical protein
MKAPQDITVPWVCLFCGEQLLIEEGVAHASGDLMNCRACGEANDVDSVIEVAREKGLKLMTEAVKESLKHEFKDLFKT